MQGGYGALYGTCIRGGGSGGGIVFELNTISSDYSILPNFSSSGTSDQKPRGPVAEGKNHMLP